MPEIWIQIENRPWDLCPHAKDRMSGMDVKDLPGGTPPVNVTLHSTTGHSRTVKMHKPVRGANGKVTDALILRRYKPPQKANGSDAWTIPDDRKVNPWDLNEMNPGENGTMGTIPGPVIECNIGDQMIVHFRNNDMRLAPSGSKVLEGLEVGALAGMAGMEMSVQRAEVRGAFTSADSALLQAIGDLFLLQPRRLPVLQRTHSLHPHGFTFAPEHDGAYPLSPADTAQLITPVGGPDEKDAWDKVDVKKFKQGDRVPPGGTFIYRWSGHSWPTTAGVWLYHDHSVCDMENVQLGAIGIIVIHNPAEPGDVTVTIDDLPDKSFVGSPISPGAFSLAVNLALFKHDLSSLVAEQALDIPGHEMESAAPRAASRAKKSGKASRTTVAPRKRDTGGAESELPKNRIEMGPFMLAVNKNLDVISRLFIATYRTPPTKAQYLQLFHMFADNMCINGRLFLGNTPTMVAGPQTKMRFGVVGMGSEPHTFHIHGHRWVIPGPARVDDSTLQFGGPMNSPTSQFEDTRLLGPANSFVFTIDEGNGFMRAADQPIGEWHMHCHLLGHMMSGMMGSLLVVNGGQLALALPVGKPCPTMPKPKPPSNGSGAQTIHIKIQSAAFGSQPGPIHVGDTVVWDNKDGFDHTVSADDGTFNLPSPGNSSSAQWVASRTGSIPYHCNIHTDMHGSITVS